MCLVLGSVGFCSLCVALTPLLLLALLSLFVLIFVPLALVVGPWVCSVFVFCASLLHVVLGIVCFAAFLFFRTLDIPIRSAEDGI